MAPEKVDSLDADRLKPLVRQLLTRIDELLAQIKAQNALLTNAIGPMVDRAGTPLRQLITRLSANGA
jgi:hypothetical protein